MGSRRQTTTSGTSIYTDVRATTHDYRAPANSIGYWSFKQTATTFIPAYHRCDCQSGVWANVGGSRSIFGGTYTLRLAGNNYNGMMPLGCSTANPVTNSCSCESGFIASEIGRGGYYHYAAWDTLYIGYICTKTLN